MMMIQQKKLMTVQPGFDDGHNSIALVFLPNELRLSVCNASRFINLVHSNKLLEYEMLGERKLQQKKIQKYCYRQLLHANRDLLCTHN